MAANKIDFVSKLRSLVRPQPSLEDVFAVLSDFKTLGGTQAEALEILEQLRSEARDEETEDCILEMMVRHKVTGLAGGIIMKPVITKPAIDGVFCRGERKVGGLARESASQALRCAGLAVRAG